MCLDGTGRVKSSNPIEAPKNGLKRVYRERVKSLKSNLEPHFTFPIPKWKKVAIAASYLNTFPQDPNYKYGIVISWLPISQPHSHIYSSASYY
ncbi:hypothetical protein CFP56_043830 [Quercus suber]|uniref:Uncharacterized protein n=1 Tax=Quercus suber TaxID=58331 RepID=A0AAW0LHW9_QUESU